MQSVPYLTASLLYRGHAAQEGIYSLVRFLVSVQKSV